MITKEKLKSVKKIIVHKFCHDGTSSAMIIKDVLHNVEVFFASHKDKEYLELKAQEGLLFCDIAPPPGREREFLRVKSIVLDHHEKSKDAVLKFEHNGLGVYGEMDKGESGATLAYRHVWLPLKEEALSQQCDVEKLARLAGIRDTWQKDSDEWEDALLQTEALAFYPTEHFLHPNHPAKVTVKELEIAEIIRERYKSTIQRVTDSAFILYWNEIKIGIIPGHRTISDVAEELRKKDVPIIFAFTFKLSEFGTPCFSASIRSDGSFDCNKFAGNWDGGGHVKAAGSLTVDIKDNTLNPYSLIRTLLEEFGNECLIEQKLA